MQNMRILRVLRGERLLVSLLLGLGCLNVAQAADAPIRIGVVTFLSGPGAGGAAMSSATFSSPYRTEAHPHRRGAEEHLVQRHVRFQRCQLNRSMQHKR